MSRYLVQVAQTKVYEIEIEAEDVESAKDKATEYVIGRNAKALYVIDTQTDARDAVDLSTELVW